MPYHWLAGNTFRELYPKSKEAALKAIQLDDSLAEAHGALAGRGESLDSCEK